MSIVFNKEHYSATGIGEVSDWRRTEVGSQKYIRTYAETGFVKEAWWFERQYQAINPVSWLRVRKSCI